MAFPQDFERLPVVAASPTLLAGDVDVGKEVHLYLDGSVALAGIATTAGHVEGKPSRLVAAGLGLGHGSEQRQNPVEELRVGGWVAARSSSNRRLIDVDRLVDLIEPLDPLVQPGQITRAV